MNEESANIDDPTPEQIEREGRLDETKEWLKSDFDRSRDLETQTVNELEKSLWLANSGAATVTIGYLTANNDSNLIQYLGCCMFVVAIVSLLIMRTVSAINSSRDRNRRQILSDRFFTENRPISTLSQIRDNWFSLLRYTYLALKGMAILLFVFGCILTLIGVYPQI